MNNLTRKLRITLFTNDVMNHHSYIRYYICVLSLTGLLVSLVSGPALVPVPRDGADVEEVLTVFTEGVFRRLVTRLEMLSQRGSVGTQQLAEVTPTPLPIHWS